MWLQPVEPVNVPLARQVDVGRRRGGGNLRAIGEVRGEGPRPSTPVPEAVVPVLEPDPLSLPHPMATRPITARVSERAGRFRWVGECAWHDVRRRPHAAVGPTRTGAPDRSPPGTAVADADQHAGILATLARGPHGGAGRGATWSRTDRWRHAASPVEARRMLWGYVRANPVPFVISIIGAAIYAGAAVGMTIALGRITNDVIVPSFETGRVSSSTVLAAGARC